MRLYFGFAIVRVDDHLLFTAVLLDLQCGI